MVRHCCRKRLWGWGFPRVRRSWCAAEFSGWRRIERAAGIRVVRLVTRLLDCWPGHRLGFGDRQPSTVIRDRANKASHGRFRLHGDPFDYESALSAMTTPRLLLSVEDDQPHP
jgi:predicted alpha/beta hydrolase